MSNTTLQIDAKELAACRKEISVVVPKTDVKKAYNKALGELNAYVKIPGFRQGKAPKSMLIKKYGESVTEQVQEGLLRETMQTVFQDETLIPLSAPELAQPALVADADYAFKMTYDVAPKVELPEYKGLAVTRAPYVEDTAAVADAEARLLESRATLTTVDRAVQAEDYVQCAVKVTLKTDEEVPAEAQTLLDSDERWVTIIENAQIPEAAAQLTGLAVGDNKTYTATYPADYNFNDFLKGKEADFDVTVKEVKAFSAPVLTAELAEEMGYESIEALKEKVAKDLADQFDATEKGKMADQALEQLLETFTCDLPPTVFQNEVNKQIHAIQHKDNAHAHGEECDHKAEDATDEEKKEAEEVATKAIKTRFLLSEVAKVEDVKVEEYEVYSQVVMMASQYGMNPQDLYKQLAQNHYIDQMREELLLDKSLRKIVEFAEVSEVTA